MTNSLLVFILSLKMGQNYDGKILKCRLQIASSAVQEATIPRQKGCGTKEGVSLGTLRKDISGRDISWGGSKGA